MDQNQNTNTQPSVIPPTYIATQTPQSNPPPFYVLSTNPTPDPNMQPTSTYMTTQNPNYVYVVPPNPTYMVYNNTPTPPPPPTSTNVQYHNVLMPGGDVYVQIKERNYDAPITFWIDQGWQLFKLNPVFHILWAIIAVLLCIIPYVGGFIAYFYIMGISIIILDLVKTNGRNPIEPSRTIDGFKGFKLFFPLLALLLLQILVILIGLICLIIPGLFLMIAVTFAPLIYLEYHTLGITPWQSIKLSIHVVNKKFCSILAFIILLYLIDLIGVLCLIVGVFVAVPVIMNATVYAFRDTVGFNQYVSFNI